MNRRFCERTNRIRENRRRYRFMLVLFLLGLAACFSSFTKIGLHASETASGLKAGGSLLHGLGTSGNPWLIESAEDLEKVRKAVAEGRNFEGEYLKLTADIWLSNGWKGLGTLKDGATSTASGKNILPFSGTFDGGGHSVTSADGGLPLFGYVRKAVIRNLQIAGKKINGSGLILNYVEDRGEKGTVAVKTATVENVTILSGTSTLGSGFVSGYACADNTVDIIGCTVEKGVTIGYTGTQSKIGSFGGDHNGLIKDCKSAATVQGVSYVGGIMGCRSNSMSETEICNCIFSGQVIASGEYAGGIAGGGYGGTKWTIETAPNAPMQIIRNCLCTGSVKAADVAGGIEGYETAVQVWSNAYLSANLFTGSVKTTEGTCVGAIIGKLRGIDRCNLIVDNYYLEGCGADRGIGGITYVDTSCVDHEKVYGEYYFNSGKELPLLPGINDGAFPGNLRSGYNRSDDPLGRDASSLTRAFPVARLTDSTVVVWLNKARGNQNNWIQGPSGPENVIAPIPVKPLTPDPVKPPAPKAKVKKGKTYKVGGNKYKVTAVASAKKNGTVTFTGAKNAKKVTVPASVKLADKRSYKVTAVGKKAFKAKKIRQITVGKNVKKLAAYAFAGSKCSSLILKTKLLKKAKVKGCLKSSKIKKIRVKVGKAKSNKAVRKRYKKILTRKNAGKKVKIS